MRPLASLAVAGALAILPIAAQAQDFGNELKARQGQFRIMALHIGVVGAMAKGEAEYDAALAALAAQNIAAIAALHQNQMWPEGSDNAAIEGTRALPVIWEDWDGFIAKWDATSARADELVVAAGGGLDTLRPAVGALGQTCGDCHDTYRQPDD